ncbi:MAG TPA: PorV/PorQ family protein [bacterium]|jgi:hypothetical protein|nr:PorV/PorQ family protein [bacterium]
MALAGPARAVEYANSVLDLGVGARALGMGGAFVGLADDSTSTYWNPAGLTGIKNFEVNAAEQGQQTAALDLGTNDVGSDYIFLSGGWTLPQVGSFGLSLTRFAVNGIPQIPNQNTCGTCPPPDQKGTFGTSDTGVFLSYARSVAPALDMGVTVKTLFGGTNGLQADPTNNISGNADYYYLGLDLGFKLKFGALSPALEGLSLGLNLQDLLNTGVKWSNTPTSPDESVTANPKTGLAYTLPFAYLEDAHTVVNLALDVDPTVYAPSTLIHYGAEVWYKDTIAIRGGMMQFTDSPQSSEPSLGASFKYAILQVDYAYIYYELTPIEYLDLTIRW